MVPTQRTHRIFSPPFRTAGNHLSPSLPRRCAALLACLVVVLLMSTGRAGAQTLYFDSDATINTDIQFHDVRIGSINPNPFTVTVQKGAFVAFDPYTCETFHTSILNWVDGVAGTAYGNGKKAGGVIAHDGSIVKQTGGAIIVCTLLDTSHGIFNADSQKGGYTDKVSAFNSSVMDIIDSGVGSVTLHDNSVLNMSGRFSAATADFFDTSRGNFDGHPGGTFNFYDASHGTFSDAQTTLVNAFGSSVIDITGSGSIPTWGNIGGFIHDNSVLNMSGGSASGFFFDGTSHGTFSGGGASSIQAGGNATVDVTGGSNFSWIQAYGNATINITTGGKISAMAVGGFGGNVPAGIINFANATANSLSVGETGTAFVTSGHIDGVTNSGALNISGGTVGTVDSFGVGGAIQSVTNITGGNVGSVSVGGNAILNVASGLTLGSLKTMNTSQASIAGVNITGTAEAAGSNTLYFNSNTLGDAKASGIGTLLVSAQTVTGSVSALDTAVITVLSGDIGGSVTARNGSTVNLQTAGSIGGPVTANDQSTVNLHGGDFAGSLDAFGTATMSIDGGTYQGAVNAHDTSAMNLTGGTFFNTVDAHDKSTIDIGGGDFLGLVGAQDFSTVNITAGSFTDLSSDDKAILNLYGGTISSNTLFALGHGRFFLYGTDLTASDRTPFVYNGLVGNRYLLTGTLSDGATVDTHLFLERGNAGPVSFAGGLQIGGSAPEPGTLALFGVIAVPVLGRFALRRRVCPV